jgi:hypothetical protein
MAKTPMTTRGAEALRVELHRLKTVASAFAHSMQTNEMKRISESGH